MSRITAYLERAQKTPSFFNKGAARIVLKYRNSYYYYVIYLKILSKVPIIIEIFLSFVILKSLSHTISIQIYLCLNLTFKGLTAISKKWPKYITFYFLHVYDCFLIVPTQDQNHKISGREEFEFFVFKHHIGGGQQQKFSL